MIWIENDITVESLEDLENKINLGEFAIWTSLDISNAFLILLNRIKELEEKKHKGEE